MLPLKRILFPVDFSDRSSGAASYAEELAAHFDAELILLHVVEPPEYNTSLADSHRVHAEGFDKFFGQRLQRLRVKRLIEHGDAARKIVECAASQDADLIVIPTQGLGIYRRLIIGSTSAKVLHDADCPVWSGVHWDHTPPPERIHYRRICCAVDLKPHSVKVLEWAWRFAKAYHAELTLLHAGDSRSATPQLTRLLETSPSKPEIRVHAGDAATVVASLAAEQQADLLVIGRGAESGILGRLVATAYSIIRRSPCPVVSV
jgi:nucleotide-binding universal stress UspA family protein